MARHERARHQSDGDDGSDGDDDGDGISRRGDGSDGGDSGGGGIDLRANRARMVSIRKLRVRAV